MTCDCSPVTRRPTSAPSTPTRRTGRSRSSAARNLVVYFYPAALTPGCTKQACDFRDNLEAAGGLRLRRRRDLPRQAGQAREVPRDPRPDLPAAVRPGQDDPRRIRRLGREDDVRQEGHRRDPVDRRRRPEGQGRARRSTTSRRPGTSRSCSATSTSAPAPPARFALARARQRPQATDRTSDGSVQSTESAHLALNELGEHRRCLPRLSLSIRRITRSQSSSPKAADAFVHGVRDLQVAAACPPPLARVRRDAARGVVAAGLDDRPAGTAAGEDRVTDALAEQRRPLPGSVAGDDDAVADQLVASGRSTGIRPLCISSGPAPELGPTSRTNSSRSRSSSTRGSASLSGRTTPTPSRTRPSPHGNAQPYPPGATSSPSQKTTSSWS